MAEAAKANQEAAVVDTTEDSRASKDRSSQHLKHQSKANGHRHLSRPEDTNSQLHSKEASKVTEEPNNK